MQRSGRAALRALPIAPAQTRLSTRGIDSLLDHELVAVVLGNDSAAGLKRAFQLVADYDGLSGVVGQQRRQDAQHAALSACEAGVLSAARALVYRAQEQELRVRESLTSPAAVRVQLRMAIGNLEHEVFVVLFLDAQNRLIAMEELFRGTLTQTSVYPRELVKGALARNCAALIVAHNHPGSGSVEPSRADEHLTQCLRAALTLVDVRLIEHFIVSGDQLLSFAERGLL